MPWARAASPESPRSSSSSHAVPCGLTPEHKQDLLLTPNSLFPRFISPNVLIFLPLFPSFLFLADRCAPGESLEVREPGAEEVHRAAVGKAKPHPAFCVSRDFPSPAEQQFPRSQQSHAVDIELKKLRGGWLSHVVSSYRFCCMQSQSKAGFVQLGSAKVITSV